MSTAELASTAGKRKKPTSADVDADALTTALRDAVEGDVRFTAGDRALYATDASNYRQVPIGVVLPKRVEDVLATVAICRRYGAPVLSRGGGTSLAGQCCNVAVVIDFSRYLHHVLALDPERRLARVQPGLILDDLRNAAERHHLTFGPDPSTHSRCTLGGMIGNDSCGVHSVMAGKTVDNVLELDVLTYDGLRARVGKTSEEELRRIIAEGGRRGDIYRRLALLRDRYGNLVRTQFPKIPRRVSGYNLDQLLPENGFNVAGALVGTEGTCVSVLEATVKLVASPPARTLLVLGYADAFHAGNAVMSILAHHPTGLEGFEERLISGRAQQGPSREDLALLPDGGCWLMVEFGADSTAAANDQARQLVAALHGAERPPSWRLLDDPKQAARVWNMRESAVGTLSLDPTGETYWSGWEDSAVAPEQLGPYLRDLRALLDRYDYAGAFYGHFGQGCIHTRTNFDLRSAGGIAKFRSFMESAADLVVRYGGSLSGEHGDGQVRAELWPKMFGPELMQAFGEFKAIWDPENKMNPGKLVQPNRMDENLRLGVNYNPWRPATHFQFPDDHGSLANATLRCVGVGKCRRVEGGLMCPSYMATRQEQHSTRGRPHLLFEMLQGDPMRDGWQDEAVKEALDLCLACKGCKSECPVSVDMATYKAEFLSHYYHGRRRPIAAYTMGLIMWWARLAAIAPWLVNVGTQTPLLRSIVKTMGGIGPKRKLPRFAGQTFIRWFARREPRHLDRPAVLLWPDTFNNHFFPDTAKAAVDVLEAAGFRVRVPAIWLCCGRPLYDFGMLDLAKRLLERTLEQLRPEIRAGVPIVVLEPSCASVFRDELVNLFPHDEDAKRLKAQTYLLSEFLQQHAPDFQVPALVRTAVLHGHCHHKAIMGMGAERATLGKAGLSVQEPEQGCCGMAGAFGFERHHYDVSMTIGERALLPAVRTAPSSTFVIANGFSCREQIAQTTGRRPLHLAEVLQIALRQAEKPNDVPPGRNRRFHGRTLRVVAAGASLAACGAAAVWEARRRAPSGG